MAGKEVLIVYGTRYGSTGEIAAEIAEVLKDAGLRVHLVDLREEPSPSPEGFAGVLVGSSIKAERWMGLPIKFLKENRAELSGPRLGLFVSCAKALEDREMATGAYVDRTADELGLSPAQGEAFGPVFDFSESSRMGLLDRKILEFVSRRMKAEVDYSGRNDLRDHKRIRRFAADFATRVKG
jgi:menaquinone-dependent protoporphyrinogen oxidase